MAHHFDLSHRPAHTGAQAFKHDHEFVTPKARDGVALANTGHKPVGHQLQQLVAHVMALRVIEVFEVVQVDEQQRSSLMGAYAYDE